MNLKMSAFQQHKLTLMFYFQDVNRNGKIDLDDIETSAANMARFFNAEADPLQWQGLRDHMLGEWEQMKAILDTNQDGAVSLEEFLTFYDGVYQSPEMLAMLMKASMDSYYKFWHLLDPDGGGEVTTVRRYEMWLSAYGRNPHAAATIIGKLDLDGDGLVTRAEMEQRIAEVYGNDPHAAGNWQHLKESFAGFTKFTILKEDVNS